MCGMFRWKWPRVLLLGSAPLGGDVRKAASGHRGSRGCDSETMSRLTSRTSACLVNATLCKEPHSVRTSGVTNGKKGKEKRGAGAPGKGTPRGALPASLLPGGSTSWRACLCPHGSFWVLRLVHTQQTHPLCSPKTSPALT